MPKIMDPILPIVSMLGYWAIILGTVFLSHLFSTRCDKKTVSKIMAQCPNIETIGTVGGPGTLYLRAFGSSGFDTGP